ncbi:glutathione S-transferase [Hoeflea marina]|uniref:Glutathione S-transferase n=1 Tax=Hoeflea marina TaxID=274592 RepID=A0A317PGI2_9HYPH|nr:glutathione S-transferase family protein [Hoeflea marina]PWV99134.1 glutathione S-transferase [Hoeflea marina]
MTLKLYSHPLASYCWKPLIALYDNDIAFETVEVNLGDDASRSAFSAVWPLLKFPVLVDDDRGQTVIGSAAVIDYVDRFAAPPAPMIPADPDLGWQARMWDRLFDDHFQTPMQQMVGDALRSPRDRDAFGLGKARDELRAAYPVFEERLPADGWCLGEMFTLADCSALPALFWADTVEPFSADHPKLTAYLKRLKARPSAARVLKEAEPFFAWFPRDPKPRI